MCSGFYACLPSEEPYFGNSFLHYYFVITAHLNHSYQSAAAAAAKLLQSVRPHRWQPTGLCRPWDSPSKNTGVGCHFLLQCRKVKSESEVAQSCPTLRNPMDCSLQGSSVHGIFQARVLEWGAIAFSEGQCRHSQRACFNSSTPQVGILLHTIVSFWSLKNAIA